MPPPPPPPPPPPHSSSIGSKRRRMLTAVVTTAATQRTVATTPTPTNTKSVVSRTGIFVVLSLSCSLFWVEHKIWEAQQLIINGNNHEYLKQHFQSISSSSSNNSTAIHHYGRIPQKTATSDADAADNEHDNEDDGYEFHIVFSSGCNALQDWQSYAFFYQIMASGFTGNVTRVASCETEEHASNLQQLHETHIRGPMSDKFRLHTTPDYSQLVTPQYKFFNKPFGIRHWMEHNLGLPQKIDQYEKMIVILMDPDQFLMRPFRRNMTHEAELWIDPGGYRVLKRGQPMAAQYALGSSWMDDINVTQLLQIPNLTVAKREGSGLLDHEHHHWKKNKKKHKHDKLEHVSIGPPYLAVAHDMYAIVATWSDFVVPIYHQTDGAFLAEMYAYSTAAAHLKLPHQSARSFMISHPESGKDEAWVDWIDDDSNDGGGDHQLQKQKKRPNPLPHVIHFCQRYFLGPYFFSKYKVPKGGSSGSDKDPFFLSCEHALYQEPPDNVSELYDYGVTMSGQYYSYDKQPYMRRRMAFALTQILPRLNAAATFYKRHHCTSSTPLTAGAAVHKEANYNKTFGLIKNGTLQKAIRRHKQQKSDHDEEEKE